MKSGFPIATAIFSAVSSEQFPPRPLSMAERPGRDMPAAWATDVTLCPSLKMILLTFSAKTSIAETVGELIDISVIIP